MQKLEWKGPPRAGKVECNEILMLGDSMLRNINVDMMKSKKIWLFAYPGITTGQLSVQIKNDIMPPPTQIGYVFVHCGTNNASTTRHNMTVTQSAKEMEHCIETLMQFYTHAKIVISGILPRCDKENLRGQDINELVSGYCVQQKQVHYVDLSSHFDVRAKPKQFSDLYRYEQTKHLPEDNIDHVHLSDKGVQKFQDLIKEELDHVTRTKFVNTDRGNQLLTQQEWRKYRNLHRETKFNARFKICNYQPAMNDRFQAALNNETIEAYLAEQNAKRKGSHHSDHKPLPDIIPKRPKREESESPVPRKKSTENDARKTSADGDVSRSDTGPSDQEPGKRKKQEPLSKSAIRNQMNKVKKSKRERSSRRTEREASDSSSPSPERSVKSDKSIHKRRRRSMTDNDRSPAHRSKRKTDRSPSVKEESKKPKLEKDPPVSPGRKISLHPSAKKKVESDKRDDEKKRSRKRSNDRERTPVKRDKSRDRTESDRKRRREPTPQKSRSKDVKNEKKKESERKRSRSPKDRKSQKSSKRSKSRERSRRRSKSRSRSKDKHSIDEAARARNISQEETKKKKKKAKNAKKEESEESDGPSEKVKKEEKSSKSESDLKKRLLEKQKAKKSKSSAPPNTKVGVEFYQRLFRIIGIQKDACKGIAKKFYNCSFDPDEKNFKSISMFDFGTKFGVPLAYRQKIKSITAKEIKKAFSDKHDLRDSVFNDLHDSDLSDSQF